MAEDLRALEERALNAWPSLQQLVYDGWLLRFSQGYTRRANSVVPLYGSQLDLRQKVEVCRENYARRGLPTVFKMLPFAQAETLDQILEASGFESEAETSVQTCALYSLCELAAGEAREVEVPPSQWLEGYARLSAVAADDRDRLQAIIEHIAPPTCYMQLRHQGQVVTCGMGVVEGGYVGIFSLVTAPELRGRGYGRQLLGAIARWALARGAERAYLQVMPENEVASQLYCKLGFAECYRYWYRVGPQI